MKDFAPAAERNKEPIARTLGEVLPAEGLVLELASGSGQHVAHLARAFPALRWQPTDMQPRALDSIRAWLADAGVDNALPPVALDARADAWPVDRADAVLCINMIHIAPWDACLGLMRGAARVLAAGGPLVLYGPFVIDGETAPSNREFSASLSRMDPAWGVRELRDVEAAARDAGLALERVIPMPANNHVVVFRRCA